MQVESQEGCPVRCGEPVKGFKVFRSWLFGEIQGRPASSTVFELVTALSIRILVDIVAIRSPEQIISAT